MTAADSAMRGRRILVAGAAASFSVTRGRIGGRNSNILAHVISVCEHATGRREHQQPDEQYAKVRPDPLTGHSCALPQLRNIRNCGVIDPMSHPASEMIYRETTKCLACTECNLQSAR